MAAMRKRDLFYIAQRRISSIMRKVRSSETAGKEGRVMTISRRASFNPKSFLAKVGEGRSIGTYCKDQIVFSQGEHRGSLKQHLNSVIKIPIDLEDAFPSHQPYRFCTNSKSSRPKRMPGSSVQSKKVYPRRRRGKKYSRIEPISQVSETG